MDENENDPNNTDSPNFALLRKQVTELTAERDGFKTKYETARSQLVNNAAELAGFKANDDGTFTGVANLLVKEFQGSLGEDDVPTRAGFLALAEQYGVKPEVAEDTTDEGPTTAQQLAALQAPGDQLRQMSRAAEPPASDLPTQIAALEADGKWAEAGRLKRQLQSAAS
jgi:hypothetical protein